VTFSRVHVRGHRTLGPTSPVQSVQNSSVGWKTWLTHVSFRRHRVNTTPQDFSAPWTHPDIPFSNSDLSVKALLWRPVRFLSRGLSEAHVSCGSQVHLQKNELRQALLCMFVDTADFVQEVGLSQSRTPLWLEVCLAL